MVILIYGWDPFSLGLHAANFGGFRHCGNGGKKFLICHMFSNDHVFKGLPDLKGKPIIVSHQIATFTSRRPGGGSYIIYLICRVTFQYHLINGSLNFMDGSYSLCLTTMPGLMTIVIVVVEM